MSVRFTQSCSTCGRRIRIRASLLGCTVACTHCQAEFVARAGFDGGVEVDDSLDEVASADPLMKRVEEALQKAQQAAVS